MVWNQWNCCYYQRVDLAFQLRRRYEQTLCQLLKYLTDQDYIISELEGNKNVIQLCEHAIEFAPADQLKVYIKNRTVRLQDSLARIGVTCELSDPVSSEHIVINEVGTGPEGNWIELKNLTDRSIDLGARYYLSNDPTFPKKWKIPQGTIIEPQGTLNIKDNSARQAGGFVLGFIISSRGGSVLLSYEDMSEIHRLSYPKIKESESPE